MIKVEVLQDDKLNCLDCYIRDVENEGGYFDVKSFFFRIPYSYPIESTKYINGYILNTLNEETNCK